MSEDGCVQAVAEEILKGHLQEAQPVQVTAEGDKLVFSQPAEAQDQEDAGVAVAEPRNHAVPDAEIRAKRI